MSEKWPPDGWFDASQLPAHKRHAIGVQSILLSEDNPEETLQLALTHADLATVVFGVALIHDIFPEVSRYCVSLMRKLCEVTDAQAFLPDLEEPVE